MDLINREEDFSTIILDQDDVVVFAVPSFWRKSSGCGSRAILTDQRKSREVHFALCLWKPRV